MTDPGASFAVRRILVAFGPSTVSRGALEGAVEIAARLNAELEALFVEDLELIELTGLPFVRQVSLQGAGRPFVRATIEAELRALAALTQRQLEAAAALRRIRWSFRTARGRIRSEVARAAAHADLLVLASVSRPLARELRLELPLRAMVMAAVGPVLLMHPERPPAGPVHVLIESAAMARRIAQAAAELARRYESPVVVMVRAKSEAGNARLIETVKTLFPAALGTVDYRIVQEVGPAAIDALLAAVATGTLVLEAASPLLEPEALWRRVAKAPCTVLLIR